MRVRNTFQLFYLSTRCYNTSESVNIKRSVYVSQSLNVFTNLALEDWIYSKYDFTMHQILMLWRNNPCVVIGRHQNPWLEVDLQQLNEDGLNFARRNSGGGTVYHDSGNLNVTFFTCRKYYNRKSNMEFISKVVQQMYGFTLNVSPKYDLFSIDNKKVSGTASKLGRNSAYHHCTLLVHADKSKLNRLLAKRETNIHTNATESIRSSVMNLCDEISDVNMDNIIHKIGKDYLNNSNITTNENIYFILPTEENFPGLNNILNNLMSWEWRFGKTPKFIVQLSINTSHILSASVIVINGLIDEVYVKPSSFLNLSNDIKFVTNFEGNKFSEKTIECIKLVLNNTNKRIFSQTIKQTN